MTQVDFLYEALYLGNTQIEIKLKYTGNTTVTKHHK